MRYLSFLFMICISFALAQAQPGWKFYSNDALPGEGSPTCFAINGSGIYLGFTDGFATHGFGFDGAWFPASFIETDTICHYPDYGVRSFGINSAFLRIGTDHGILQRVGTGWIRINQCNTPTLLNDRIRGIAPVDDLDLWFMSETNAISKYSYENDSVINYTLSPQTPKPTLYDAKIMSDCAGRAWYVADGKLVCFTRDSARIIDAGVIPWLNEDIVVSFHILNNNSIAVLMLKHIGILNLNGTELKYSDIAIPEGLLEPSENFKLIEADEFERIWTLTSYESCAGCFSTHFYKITPERKWTQYSIPKIEGAVADNYTITGMAVDGLTTAWFIEPNFGVFACDYTNLAASETDRTSLSLYPNPASDYVSISNFNGVSRIYSIFNFLGEAILTGEIKEGRISVSALSAGAYFLRLGNENRAFIKE